LLDAIRLMIFKIKEVRRKMPMTISTPKMETVIVSPMTYSWVRKSKIFDSIG